MCRILKAKTNEQSSRQKRDWFLRCIQLCNLNFLFGLWLLNMNWVDWVDWEYFGQVPGVFGSWCYFLFRAGKNGMCIQYTDLQSYLSSFRRPATPWRSKTDFQNKKWKESRKLSFWHWRNPGRPDMSFTPFVLNVLPVYSHWWISIGVPSMNSSSVLPSLLLDFPNVP